MICLRGNRNDFGALYFQNLLVVEPRFSSRGFARQIKKTAKPFFYLWRTQRDSNLQSLPSEGNALSSYAMGAGKPNFIIHYFASIASIKSSKSPSRTAAESVFSTFVRTSLTN